MQLIIKTKNLLIGIFLLITVWQLVTLVGQFDEKLFPSPVIVFHALFNMMKSGEAFIHMKDSLIRFAVGYILAAGPAITLGIILGLTESLWNIIDPIVQLLRPVSPVAWTPFVVLWFGIGNLPAIFVIFVASFFPILLTTVNGVRTVDKNYLKIAANLQFTKSEVVRKVVLPAALPSIVNGLRMALSAAWIFLVVGEMVGAQSGLGFLILDARNTLDLENVFAGIVMIGLCGFLIDRTIKGLEFVIRKYSGFLI